MNSQSASTGSPVSWEHVVHCLLIGIGITAGIKWAHGDLAKAGEFVISALASHILLSIGVGLLILAGAKRWIFHCFKIVWDWSKPGRIPMAAFAIIVFLAAVFDQGDSPTPFYLVLAGVLWLLLIYLTCLSPKSDSEEYAKREADALHRFYFAERIADLFREKRAPRRIAILGPWGCGKSTLLRFIRERLQAEAKDYRVVMVDPWKSKTPDEAWGILAGAFDEALQLPSLLPPRWARNPIVGWLAPLLPGIGAEVAKVLGSEPSRSREALLAKVNRAVRIEKVQVVILIDDMERAEPEVLRSLFPVIDQLSEFEDCHFIFAIDPEKIAEAFHEREKGPRLSSQGFMDKVFDLQLPLPEARQDDVAEMIFARAKDDDVTPKFVAAFPSLRALIPTNPRAALRFYQDAKSKEVAFLKRYGPTERNWGAFFATLLIEKEFPGFLSRVLAAPFKEAYASTSTLELGMLDRHRGRQRITASDLASQISTALGHNVESAESRRFARLFEDIVDRADIGDLDWALKRYDKLLELSADEQQTLQQEWYGSAGQKGVEEMLRDCLPSLSNAGLKHADPARCVRQLLEHEVEVIREKTASATAARPKYPDEDIRDALMRLRRLRSHFAFARQIPNITDLAFFDEALFADWLRMMDETPLSVIAAVGGDWASMRDERAAFHLELAEPFGVFRNVIWVTRELANTFRDLPEDRQRNRDEIERHCSKIREVMYSRITPTFLVLFRDGTIADRFPTDFPETWGLESLYQPRIWLNTEFENWKQLLSNLAIEAQTNTALANACSFIARRLFLFPLWQLSRNEGGLDEWNVMQDLSKNSPDYLKFFWSAAMTQHQSNESTDKLLFYREKVLGSDKSPDQVRGFINTFFPLPVESAADE